MSTLRRIVVGHDFRPGGNIAVRSATELAKQCNAHLKLVHVIEPYAVYQRLTRPFTPVQSTEEVAQRAGEALQQLVNEMESELEIEYEVRTGKPFVELIVARRAWQADLLIVGAHAEGQSRFLGDTGERVVRKAMAPVLVAKRALSREPKTIVMPTDFSEGAKQAAREALTFVQYFGGRLVFLHVLEIPPAYAVGYGPTMGALPPIPMISPEEVEPEWKAFLADLPFLTRVDHERGTVEGHAVSVINETAEKLNADLIIMGTHGRTGLGHMLMGSVAEGVVRQASCSVLTIRSGAVKFSLP